MPLTFSGLKQMLRPMIWPGGEARSRRVAHDKFFVDALVEIQRYVTCWQQNNTDLFPHCSTAYNCGTTSFDFPRAQIKRLSVVNAPAQAVADITQTSVDVFQATASLPSDTWPGYPNTISNGFNNGFAPIGVAPNVRFEYDAPTTVTAYVLDLVAGSGIDRPSETIPFLLEGSNDSSTWNTVDSQSLTITANSPRQTMTVSVTNSTAYTHYRLSVGSVGENFQLWGIFIYRLSFTGYTGSNLVGPIDWCSEIPYDQVDYCHIANYFKGSARAGCCLPLHLYFGLPQANLSGKGVVPVPTDEGLPPGLPSLPLGYKYPQSSTDSHCRATRGLWAGDRGRIYLVPWIQTSETVMVKWDGIKREYADGDLIENDPTLINCVLLYVLAQHEKYDNRDTNQAAVAERDFNIALQGLWKDCREETMVRGCEGSNARGASPVVTLFYNDARSYTASCPSGQTGDSKTATIAAGMVSSTISKADANNRAYQQAQEQAASMLSCVDTPTTYWNVEVTGNASCAQADGAPAPDGSPTSVTIPGGQYSSTTSQAAANAIAQAAADAQAAAQLACTYWNSEQTYDAPCAESHDVTVAAHTHSSTVSQADADAKAYNAAKVEADALCPGVYYNTAQGPITQSRLCRSIAGNVICAYTATVHVSVAAGYSTSTVSQAAANQQAQQAASTFGQAVLGQLCLSFNCANVTRAFTLSPP